MRHRYIAPIILLLSGVAIYYFWMTLPSEMSPMEDRAQLRVVSTATEGSSFEYMDQYMTDLTTYLEKEVPEEDLIMSLTGRGGQTNAAFCNVMLVPSEDRDRTQQEIADRFGVTRPSLARAFAEMEQEGIISINRKTITINRMQQLRQMAK